MTYKAFLSVVCCIFTSTALDAQQLKMSDAEKSVVQIIYQKDALTVPLGTGFFINSDGTIATALHVYADALSQISQGRGGTLRIRRASRSSQQYTTAEVQIIKADPPHDLALLRIVEVKGDLWNPVGGIHALPLSMVKEIEPGSPVMVVG